MDSVKSTPIEDQQTSIDKKLEIMQENVARMRTEVPQTLTRVLEKEFKVMKRNLREVKVPPKTQEEDNINNLRTDYVFESLKMMKPPQDTMTKQIELNAKSENVIKCLGYFKK